MDKFTNKKDLEIFEKIKIEIEKIRPKLAIDGGDIEIINFKNGILKVRMLGECSTCSMLDITMKHIIKENLTKKIPEIKDVINVNLNIIKSH